MSRWHLAQARRVLKAGGILAYPTEAVYGLGCDPRDREAVLRLLALKQRDWRKGLILIAADFAQLQPFVLPLDEDSRKKVLAAWPGPITWLLPARADAPWWLRGASDKLAVRVTGHPLCAQLCRVWGGPLVSTSANLSRCPPARRAWQVRRAFGAAVDYLLPGSLGGRRAPSEIRDLASGRVLRSG